VELQKGKLAINMVNHIAMWIKDPCELLSSLSVRRPYINFHTINIFSETTGSISIEVGLYHH